MPKLNAAVNPISVHISGSNQRERRALVWTKQSTPKVNIVVGQGKPKVGE